MQVDMEVLDELYVQKCDEPELLPLLKELRKRVLATKFRGNVVPRTDPEFLAKFIRVRQNDIEAALKMVEKYYYCIHKYRDIVDGLRPSKINPEIIKSGTYYPLKHRLGGRLVVVGIIRNWDTKKASLIEYEQSGVLVMETYASDVELQKNGCSGIVDLGGLRLEHVRQVTLKEIHKGVDVGLRGMPARLGEIHFINIPKIFWPVFYVVKPFIKQKYLDRVHFHRNLESLHKHFDKRYLPECVGGELSNHDACDWEFRDASLQADVPFEEYWNGALWKPSSEQVGMLSRRKSKSA